MTRLSQHLHREQRALLAACATGHATHLTGHSNRPISFDDIRRLPEPEWATRSPRDDFWPGRFTVDALVPAGQLAVVPLPAAPVLDDIDTVTAELAAAFAARPELRHDTALLMALAPIVAQLGGAS